MSDRSYSETLEKARADLAAAKADLFALENKVQRLERTVLALTSLVEQPAIDPSLGITDGIKGALRSVIPRGLYPSTVKQQLEKAGFDFSEHKNAIGSVTTILKRLEKQGHVRVDLVDGRTAYFWEHDKSIKERMEDIRAGRVIFDDKGRMTDYEGNRIDATGRIIEPDDDEDEDGDIPF